VIALDVKRLAEVSRPPLEHGADGTGRKRPAKLNADMVYDIPRWRQAVLRRWIKLRVVHKGVEPKDRLGHHR
jgi:hypothetical protein